MPLNEAEVHSLASKAAQLLPNSYCPYSKFPVAAVLLGQNGQTYGGVNVECASYPVTTCAERSAVVSAVSQGCRQFRAVAVATELPEGGAPCGMCRQILVEFGNYEVFFVNKSGEVKVRTSTLDLLPHAFTPASLHEHAQQ